MGKEINLIFAATCNDLSSYFCVASNFFCSEILVWASPYPIEKGGGGWSASNLFPDGTETPPGVVKKDPHPQDSPPPHRLLKAAEGGIYLFVVPPLFLKHVAFSYLQRDRYIIPSRSIWSPVTFSPPDIPVLPAHLP